MAGGPGGADSQIDLTLHSATLPLPGVAAGRANLGAGMVTAFPEFRTVLEREMALAETTYGLEEASPGSGGH